MAKKIIIFIHLSVLFFVFYLNFKSIYQQIIYQNKKNHLKHFYFT